MRKLILLFLGINAIASVNAQNKATIEYKETLKLDIKVEGMPENMASMLPKEESNSKLLIFNQDAAIFKNKDNAKAANNIEREQDGARFVIKRDIPDNKTYIDRKSLKCFDHKEFMGKKFLIESELKDLKWKILPEQKEILGYKCQAAELLNPSNKDNKVKVWFSPELSASLGPLGLGNLPGLILEVDINNGKNTITAQNIKIDEADDKLIIKPTEGKKVSKKEFEEIAEAKRKELQEQYGGDGNVILKIRQN